MTEAEENLNIFFNQFKELLKLNQSKNSQLSNVDIELSNLYHKIEGTIEFDCNQSHDFIIQLKDVLGRRRVLKLETIALRSTCDKLKDIIPNISNSHEQLIKKNSEVLKEISDNAK